MAATPPLSPHVPIADERGRPTPQFIQWWTEQRGMNNLIVPLTNTSEVSAVLDLLGDTPGAILTRGAAGWQMIVPGATGEVLTAAGPGAIPAWSPPPSFLALPDTPADYAGAAGQVATVNSNEDGLVFAPGGGGGGGGGAMLANGWVSHENTGVFRQAVGADLRVAIRAAEVQIGAPANYPIGVTGGAPPYTVTLVFGTALPAAWALNTGTMELEYDGTSFSETGVILQVEDAAGSRAYAIVPLRVGGIGGLLSALTGVANAAVYMPGVPGCLWNDTSGTIPATEPGDVVRRMTDLTGNGYDFTASGAVIRLMVDEIGRHYIDFGSAGARMSWASSAWVGTNGGLISIACRNPNPKRNARVFGTPTASGGNIELGYDTTNYFMKLNNTSTGVPYVVNDFAVISEHVQASVTTLRINGAAATTMAIGALAPRIHELGSGNSSFAPTNSLRFYGCVLVGEDPSPGLLATVETYLGGLIA